MEKAQNSTFIKYYSFLDNQFVKAVRLVNPSFRLENPYIYKLDSKLKSKLINLYKKEIKKKRRVFTFQEKSYSLNHRQVKLANLVFKNTDITSTMLGCFNVLFNSLDKKYSKKSKEFSDDIFLFLKFIVFAYSPLLNVHDSSIHFHDAQIVRIFFLHLAQESIHKYGNDFMNNYISTEHLKNEKIEDYSLKTHLFKSFRNLSQFSPYESFAFHYLNKFIENTNGDTSVIRKNMSRHQSINYFNYSNLVMEVYLFCKKSMNTKDAKFGYLLGLSHMIKLELALRQNKKHSLNSFSTLNNSSYTSLSLYQTKILENLMVLGMNDIPKINEVYSILTESENKLWLKDEPKMTTSAIIALVLNYLFMIVWGIIILYPVALLIKLTFNDFSVHELNTIQFEFSARNFEFLFKETLFLSWTKNTFIVAFSTAFIVTLFCSFLAYAYLRFEFRGKKVSIGMVMIFQMIPAGLALVVFVIYGKFFTDYLEWKGVHLLVLIIIYSGMSIAGNTFLLKGYMDTISPDVFDAARIDGCSHIKVFWTIALPLAKPMMAVIFLWSFIFPFFDFLLPSILAGNVEKDLTMAAGLNTLLVSRTASGVYSPGAYAAGGLLVALPFSIIFLSLNKQIVSGLTAGAVK